MHTFLDAQNRKWNLNITFADVRRVRHKLNINMLGDAQGVFEIAQDPVMFLDYIYVLIEPQLEAAGISDEEFGEVMARSDIYSALTMVYVEAITDFFIQYDPDIGHSLKKAFQEDPDIQAAMNEMNSMSSGKSQDLSESTPTATTSES